jgi:hypothetical protein
MLKFVRILVKNLSSIPASWRIHQSITIPMTPSQRLPIPYRAEAEVTAHCLQAVHQGLDWAAAARAAAPDALG